MMANVRCPFAMMTFLAKSSAYLYFAYISERSGVYGGLIYLVSKFVLILGLSIEKFLRSIDIFVSTEFNLFNFDSIKIQLLYYINYKITIISLLLHGLCAFFG